MTGEKPAIGRTYGRWTVVGPAVLTPRGESKWPCRCACGTERSVLERSLVYGGSLSCGCVRREAASAANASDLAGKTFGELTAIRRVEKRTKNGGAVWLCACSCGGSCEVLASLLVTGRKAHCGCKTDKQYHHTDIAGKRFGRLTALYPLEQRSKKGNVIWHCACDCGSEVDVAYNELAYTNRQSCGCSKRENDARLQDNLTRVDGTLLDLISSKKLPSNNTTGYKGVYRIRGKYVAKLVFQKKQYYLGKFDRIEDAVEARREAESCVMQGTVDHYARWKLRADSDPQWGQENPIRIHVSQGASGAIAVTFLPALSS